MRLEVCVDSLESATNAVYNGADELEVCRSLNGGGLTPTLELVQQIKDMISLYVKSHPYASVMVPKVNIMIRCREGWDFCYNKKEIENMLDDISNFKLLDVDRFVFGGLTDTKQVDAISSSKIFEHACPKPVTFHRAFDMCQDPHKALEDIIQLGFDRVLTSGQRESAADEKAVKLILSLLTKYGDKIEIMPGAGINVENARMFVGLGCKIVHGSFKRMKRAYGDEMVFVTDGEIVKKVKDITS